MDEVPKESPGKGAQDGIGILKIVRTVFTRIEFPQSYSGLKKLLDVFYAKINSQLNNNTRNVSLEANER
jgi:hypothetical protein